MKKIKNIISVYNISNIIIKLNNSNCNSNFKSLILIRFLLLIDQNIFGNFKMQFNNKNNYFHILNNKKNLEYR